MPIVMFIGNVTASAIGKNNPGFAFGVVIFMAAGTAMYDALAANMAKMNLLPTSWVTYELTIANRQPFISGIIIANAIGNQPLVTRLLSLRPLTIPMSKRNMAKKPLNISLVKGLIPSACSALAM